MPNRFRVRQVPARGRSTRATVGFAGVLAVLALPSQGRAYTEYPSHWAVSALPVPYRVNASSAPATIATSAALDAVRAGFDAWSTPSCTDYAARYAGPSDRSYVATADGENTVLWITGAAGSWPPELGDERSTLAATTPVWQGTGPFIEADLRFNAVGFAWSLDGAPDTIDVESIATHEAGHFLGLGHSLDPGAVMYATFSGGTRRVLANDDVLGVCALYPAGDGGTCVGDAGPCVDAARVDDVATDAQEETGGPDARSCGCAVVGRTHVGGAGELLLAAMMVGGCSRRRRGARRRR